MALDRTWAEVARHLSPLELRLVFLLSLEHGTVQATTAELARRAGAHPDTVGRTLRTLHRQLLNYRPGWGRRPLARLELLALDGERLPRVLAWLRDRQWSEPHDKPGGWPIPGSVKPGSPVLNERLEDRAIPGCSDPGGSVLNDGREDRAIPGPVKADSLLGAKKALAASECLASCSQLSAQALEAIQTITLEVCGRAANGGETAMWRELFCDRGLTLDQLHACAEEICARGDLRPRTTRYFLPRLLEILDGDEARPPPRSYGRPDRRAGNRESRPADEPPDAQWRRWAADVIDNTPRPYPDDEGSSD